MTLHRSPRLRSVVGALSATAWVIGVPLRASAQDSIAARMPRAVGAPEWTAVERDQRKAALNAVLSFRPDLRADSATRVAACALEAQVQDSAAARWVPPEVRPVLIRPPVSGLPSILQCSVGAFTTPGMRVLWLASLVEVKRRGTAQAPGPAEGLSFEANFQRLEGPSYRRFEQYRIEPRNAAGREWRVVRYELLGEEYTDNSGRATRGP